MAARNGEGLRALAAPLGLFLSRLFNEQLMQSMLIVGHIRMRAREYRIFMRVNRVMGMGMGMGAA